MTQTDKMEKNIAFLESNRGDNFIGPKRSFYDNNYDSTSLFWPTFVCTNCMRDGHISTHCRVKNNLNYYGLMWVLKRIKVTNQQGPKKHGYLKVHIHLLVF